MKVYVIHLFRSDPGILDSKLDGARRLLSALHQSDAMIGLTSRTVTGDFSQNLRTPTAGVFVFFEHEHPRSLCQDKSIAIRGEWPRAFFRCRVPFFRQDSHQNESLNCPQ